MSVQKRGSALIAVDKDGLGPTQRALSHARLESQQTLSMAPPNNAVQKLRTPR